MADKPNITKEGYVTRLVQVGVWATPQNPIQYAFLEQKPAYLPNEPGWTVLSAAQRAAVQYAFTMIAEVVNLTFVQVADNQQQPGPGNPRINFYANSINLNYSGSMDAYQSAGSSAIHGADIRFNTARIAQRQANEGHQDFTTLVALHEVMHAMGLSHPGNYNGQGPTYQNDAEFVEDTVQYSMMSYFAAANTGADHTIGSVLYSGRTPLLYDILALQSLYSPNMTTRAGDTVYGFNSNTGANSPFNFAVTTGPVVAIWDGGGIDTIDLSGYSGASLIDLNEGAFSDAGGLTKNIAIAFNVTIENAVGGAGNDRLIGNAVANRLDGGAGADQMEGGAGDDVYIVDVAGDVVVELAGAGTDELRTALATYVLPTHVENLTGTSPAGQTLTGNDLANVIIAGGGNDVLDGGSGADQLAGGLGNDLYLVDGGDSVYENPGGGTDEVRTALAAYALTSDVENLTGTSAAGQILTGNGLANLIIAGAGDDVLDGGAGADQLAGGLGNDVYVVDAGDSAYENPGGGTDEVRTALAAYALGTDVENLTGTSASGQTLSGNGLANFIVGGAGDDMLDGGAGADQLAGGLGNDLYVVEAGDSVYENPGGGTDQVQTALAAYALTSDVENLTGTSASGQTLTGNGLANLIIAGGGDDVLDGGAGADQLAGGLGNDLYLVDAGDVVYENPAGGTDEVRTALAAYALTSDVENLTGTSAGGQTLTGNGLANLIIAGGGNDVLDGGAGADQLAGGLGNDVYLVDAGDIVYENPNGGTDQARTALAAYALTSDVENLTGTSAAGQILTGNGLANIIVAGDGNDTLDGQAGADQLAGGLGNDLYLVDSGDTVTEGAGAGTDEVRTALAAYALTSDVENLTGTSAGGQTLTGNGLANLIIAGGGNDTLDGGAGADQLAGGLGNDLYLVDSGDIVYENPNGGTDEVRTALAAYALTSDVDNLTGTSAAGQILTGNNLANLIIAGGGDDVLDGGAGADQLAGGLGNDLYLVDAGDIVYENPNGGIDEVRTALAAYALTSDVENLIGTSAAGQTLTGNSLGNVIAAGAGNDLLLLHDGGNDAADGGAGNDVLYFGAALGSADVANGGEGRDAIVLQGNVTAVLTDANLVGIESISIQSGGNGFFGDTANNLYDTSLTTADGNVAAGQQMIVNAQSLRSGEDFTFDGSAESDGRFLVYGGHGVDNLTGGDGADVFFFEGSRWGPSDRVDGGGGRDALVISAGDGLTRIEFSGDSFTGIESISLNNHFASDPSQRPSYELVLHNGNVAPGGTLIVNGNSIPLGQIVNIDGRAVENGNLMLFAGGGHDVLSGGNGADLIFGGGGADSLSGGAGADTFRYDATTDSNGGLPDLIGDFQTGLDRIDLGRIDANTIAEGNQAFTWIGSSAFSGTGAASAGELRLFEEGGYQRIEGDTNGDGSADLVILLQIGTAPLVQGDFLL